MEKECKFRFAKETEVNKILYFIHQIAIYEKMEDQVEANEELLHEWIFEKKIANVFFIECDNKEVGFALYFFNFSTFVGRAGLYLEDLFILPEYRGYGFGKKALKKLGSIALENNCRRFEWVCLDWNKPSINFYLSMGAKAMDEWTIYRVQGEDINKLVFEK